MRSRYLAAPYLVWMAVFVVVPLVVVIYFAFTTKISVCEDKHAFISEPRCPVCGKPVADTYARVVGFYTPVSSYQKVRKREFDRRKWMNVLSNDGVMQ